MTTISTWTSNDPSYSKKMNEVKKKMCQGALARIHSRKSQEIEHEEVRRRLLKILESPSSLYVGVFMSSNRNASSRCR